MSESGTKTSITLETEIYKYTRRRVDKKEDRGWVYCYNAQKSGCLSKATSAINGNISDPKSYTLLTIDDNHTCIDTNLDRMRDDAIRIMKEEIMKNPAKESQYSFRSKGYTRLWYNSPMVWLWKWIWCRRSTWKVCSRWWISQKDRKSGYVWNYRIIN